MSVVFHLTHTHEQPCGCDDTKDIGTYSSQENGVKAAARAMQLPGFRDHKEGFHLQKVELDKDGWTEGFVTVPAPDMLAGARSALSSKLAGVNLERIAEAMKESDGRRIARREVGEFVKPHDVEAMATALIAIRDALAAEAS